MWREHAARRAAIVVAVLVTAACIVWALLAQSLTTPACELVPVPTDSGPLVCPSPATGTGSEG